jgi:nucleoside-diphosphate-sugar epimerase
VKDAILLTGATGALGSVLLQRLLVAGYEVICLVRAPDAGAARARIEAITGDRHDVKVIRGDVTELHCGIGEIDRQLMSARVKHVLHCAASINFQEKVATHLTNIDGVRHVLQLTDDISATRFLHVSTAYVVGDGEYLSEKGLSNGQHWRNPYEQSKYVGETMVRAWAAGRPERQFTVFRPSALIGAEDGTTSTYDGYYRYFEPIHRAAENLRKRKGKPLPPDIAVDDDGLVRMPIALLVANQSINHIPIDWVADMIVAAIDAPSRNQTYNLVHPDPPRIRDCLFWSLDYLKVGGVTVCDSQAEKDAALRTQTPLLNRMQRRIDAIHDAYAPYCQTDPRFEMAAASRDLGSKFRLPPVVDQPFLTRMLEYAIKNNWGAKKPKAPVRP